HRRLRAESVIRPGARAPTEETARQRRPGRVVSRHIWPRKGWPGSRIAEGPATMTKHEQYLRFVRAYLSAAGAVLLPLATLACDGDRRAAIPDDDRRNVMVIDDGIDPASPALNGKIAALYTIDCQGADPTDGAP